MSDWNAAPVALAALLEEARAAGVPLPDRRFGVGKRMGGLVWMHRSAADALGVDLSATARALPAGFDWTVARWAADVGATAFITSPDFDSADEPSVGESVLVRADGRTTRTVPPRDPWIWHHRWTMVRPDYAGFDVAAALRRSIAWKRLVGVDRALSSRIGKRAFWLREVVPRLV